MNSKYCVRRVVDKRRQWVPLKVQPAPENIVVLRQLYAHHKTAAGYRKRVSWLEGNAGVAFYEYIGSAPTSLAPHGNKRNAAGEYVRTTPDVLKGIRAGLVEERRRPHDVYVRMTVDGDSFSRPRDHKQVRNVAQKVAVRKGAVAGKCNEADELQRIVGNIHDSEFVNSRKSVCATVDRQSSWRTRANRLPTSGVLALPLHRSICALSLV